ncbi:DNA internalization-related competence protein ComEC/Rec2 [Butyrivibrio sp. YAB3001]|uniref:DNA internalization-related competence protein ComEC/Rec2 n=1 Tax=Butyrivibrio sp. YAB3001 TaxID=1520812 RepID=UPI0008F67E53|nr:DNA internalization-related competence protein ComEC/Rec2 [Butyrivibrio sp. YAB3001]SFB72094.1 competence protein ComEC [Butyrivibrio sp. YAB3001]
MKRPLCFISVVITVIVYLYLELFSSKYLIDYSEIDGELARIVGTVDKKEYKVDYLGEIAPVIYIIPSNETLGKNRYIQCYMSSEDYVEPLIGQQVEITGKIQSFSAPRNFGEFDTPLYYSTLKIAYRIKNARILQAAGKCNLFYESLYKIKYSLEAVFDRNLGKDDSSIMKAVILGDKSFMDEETRELYKNSGIIHILAVSGLHISIIGMGIYKLLRKIKMSQAAASVIPILFMYAYGQMCGMSSSAARAIVMFALRLIAPIIGRTYDMLTSLSVVEIMLLFEQPLYLYNSGFLFSFGAIIGIAYIKPKLEKVFKKRKRFKMNFADDKEPGLLQKLLNYCMSGVTVSISILLVTLPVYMSCYYTYPIWSIFLNLFIIPLMAPLMIMGIICAIVGSFLPFRLFVLQIPIHFILKFYELLCKGVNDLPGRNIYLGHTTKWKIAIYYCILLLVFGGMISKAADIFRRVCSKRKACVRNGSWNNKRVTKIQSIVSGFLIITGIIILIYSMPSPLKISMIDVGQGDGILIRNFNESILIDGGSTDKKEIGKYSIIPFLKYEGIGSLRAIVVTHEDEDHVSGIFEIMDDMEKGGIKIKNLILPNVSKASRGDNYHRLEERAKSLGINVSYIGCGDELKLMPGGGNLYQLFDNNELTIKCLNPENNMITQGANAYSTVLFLKYGKFKALFTGDVEKEGEEHLLEDLRENAREYSNLTLLKVAHHGSKYTTCDEFMELTNPKIAIISCGIDNRYGHPHDELLERLKKAGTQIYRTDESGEITVDIEDSRVFIDEYLNSD